MKIIPEEFIVSGWFDRSKIRVFEKSFREQTKFLCICAFWELIKSSARSIRHLTGFVEWQLLETQIEELLEYWGKEE